MRRLAENQEAELENQDSNEPNLKRSRSENRIATMDNGTLVEALKFLDYCQLAKKSQISKKFRDLIRTHRHSFALLNVFIIRMGHAPLGHYPIQVFEKQLSPEEYNQWVICNGYSKQISLESQVDAEKESQVYGLEAYADYNGSHFSGVIVTHVTSFFKARAEVNHENWPLFQHFVRLLTDPFIYIQSMELAYQSDVLNLLALAIGQDHSRLRCQRLEFNLRGINIFNLMSWIKGHVLCNEFQIYDYARSDCDQELLAQELLALFVTGANCTSKIVFKHYNFSKVLKDLVKKFMDIKNSDEFTVIQSIQSNATGGKVVEEFERDHAEFLVKRKNENGIATHTFEFENNNVGKKLQLTVTKPSSRGPYFSLKIDNL